MKNDFSSCGITFDKITQILIIDDFPSRTYSNICTNNSTLWCKMRLIHYYGFQFFCLHLLLIIVPHQCESESYNFTDHKELVDLCQSTNWKLPKTKQECERLQIRMRLRYGEDFIEKCKSKTAELFNGDVKNPIHSPSYWNLFFTEVALNAAPVECFMKDIGLKELPVNRYEWNHVKYFLQPRMNNVISKRNKIRVLSAVDSREFKFKSDYVNGFITLSKLYVLFVPSSRLEAILKYFGFNKKPYNSTKVIETIGNEYLKARELALVSDSIALSRRFMESSERLVLLLNVMTIDECQSIIIKVLIMQDYYGLQLEKLTKPEAFFLLRSSIHDFFNACPKYKQSTKYPFTIPTTPSTGLESLTTQTCSSAGSKSSTNPVSAMYEMFMKKLEVPIDEFNSGKTKPLVKLSDHYVACRMMLLTNSPEQISDVKAKLNDKTDDEFCMAWQVLYEKLFSHMHVPQDYVEGYLFWIEDRIEAIKRLPMDEAARNLFAVIVEVEGKSMYRF